MKRFALSLCTATVFLFACNSSDKKETTDETTTTGDTTTSNNEAWVPVDSATATKAWMDFATPGKVHEMMASWNGTWEGQMTSWMADGAPPTTSNTTAVNSMILGGRYQSSKHTSSFAGMPFEGYSTLGYDNAKKMLISTWVDNMGSGIMVMKGTWDDATKTANFTGTQTDPARGKDCNIREVYKVVDDNNHVMEMYGPDPMTGKEYKMMEIKMTRKS